MSLHELRPDQVAAINAFAARRLAERMGALSALKQLLAVPLPVDAEGDETPAMLDHVSRSDLCQLVDVLAGDLEQQAYKVQELADQALHNTLALLDYPADHALRTR
ncbi:hypothetical protein N5E30_05950 [Pseudomonas chengduensis]|uniref:Uncharacterized protein n=1 Tax=Pseudomonas sihuiensis TaxID=1274359 RepID=A0A1H2L4G7_9PSED|nr:MULTISPECIES: hypothetical protein [Pseudomonas]MDH1681125.1 hypothetical protein [Pseudomonas chengduensis]SDU75428.1 hypothetical protein SAMN05216363_0028 [Pseudomonas sihuiensis]